ncbi:MAG: cytochrome C [Gemmatimonadota bacterium]
MKCTMRWPSPRSVLLTLATMLMTLGSAPFASARADTVPRDSLIPYLDARKIVLPVSAELRALRARRIPSFSRQTKLACSACHYGFPQLTPFGRMFKLNGYTLTGLTTINAGDSAKPSLQLAPLPPLSAMAIVSLTNTAKAQPETQNNAAVFPDQLSVFLAGQVAPRFGAFVQLTYAAPDGSIGLDNTEFRFANRAHVFSSELLYGVTLHNNPTMQDVWNTVPAWGFPFVGSSAAPSPTAGSIIDGALGQQVVGLGAYGLWNNLVYTEFTAYRSAQQGASVPPGSDASNVAHNVIPYWRVALQHQFGRNYIMVGTYGLAAHLYPAGVSGLTDRYTDVAGDLQFERQIQSGALVVRSTFIHESQLLDALATGDEPGAANLRNSLNVFRANASYMPTTRYNFSLGYFNTSGSRDALLYPAEPLTGSANGTPGSSGALGEADFNAWQNVRLGAQYVAYAKFNGATHSYDGSGRSAADNNTLYLFTWVAF